MSDEKVKKGTAKECLEIAQKVCCFLEDAVDDYAKEKGKDNLFFNSPLFPMTVIGMIGGMYSLYLADVTSHENKSVSAEVIASTISEIIEQSIKNIGKKEGK